MSWGFTWGTGFGGCSDITAVPPQPTFFVVSARATSSSTYVVQFSQQPTAASPISPIDAINLANVELVRLDTLEVIPLLAGGAVPGSPLLVEYILLGEFESELITYETRHDNLISFTGSLFVEPKQAQFDGMPADQLPREQIRPLLDYFNPQAEGDLINGGLVVGTNADYVLEGGVSLMRKLIIRRVLTAQDEFFHLSDRIYGLGVQSKLTYTVSDLVGFKRQLEQEVVKEPEISQATATVSLDPSHELNIVVRALLSKTNQQIEISLPLNLPSKTTVVT